MFLIYNSKNKEKFDNRIIFGKHEIERVDKAKYIGLWLDDKMTWKAHIKYVKEKITKNIYLITSTKRFFPRWLKNLLYNAVIRCHLEYGIAIWGHKINKELVNLQKRAIRAVAGAGYNCHTSPIFIALRQLKLVDIAKFGTCNMSFKITHGPIPKLLERIVHFKSPKRHTRSSKNLDLEPAPKGADGFMLNAPIAWNNLDLFTKESGNIDKFHSLIKTEIFCRYNNEPLCKVKDCHSCKQLDDIFLFESNQEYYLLKIRQRGIEI